MIVSQSRQENFSRTVWITFHWRGITSSVSVMSSPSFDSLRRTAARAALRRRRSTTRSRGRCSGNGLRDGPLALEGLDGLRLGRRLLGRQLVLGRRRLQLLQLKLHLVEEPRLALRAACRRARAAASRSPASDARSALRCSSDPLARWPPRPRRIGELGLPPRCGPRARRGSSHGRRQDRREAIQMAASRTRWNHIHPRSASQNRHPTEVGRQVSWG